jgi:hypothetical protein
LRKRPTLGAPGAGRLAAFPLPPPARLDRAILPLIVRGSGMAETVTSCAAAGRRGGEAARSEAPLEGRALTCMDRTRPHHRSRIPARDRRDYRDLRLLMAVRSCGRELVFSEPRRPDSHRSCHRWRCCCLGRVTAGEDGHPAGGDCQPASSGTDQRRPAAARHRKLQQGRRAAGEREG